MLSRCVLVLIAVFIGLDGVVLVLGSLWFGDTMTSMQNNASVVVGLLFVLLAIFVPQSERGSAGRHPFTRLSAIAISISLLVLTAILVQHENVMAFCADGLNYSGHLWLDVAGAIVMLSWLLAPPRTVFQLGIPAPSGEWA